MIIVDLNGAALLDYCCILEPSPAKNHFKLSSYRTIGCRITQRINIMSNHRDRIDIIVKKIGLERVDIKMKDIFIYSKNKFGMQ